MKQYKKIIFLTTSIMFCSFLVLGNNATAADLWQDPPAGCDPSSSDFDGCDIAAPLNTSDDEQTKSGALIIEGSFEIPGYSNSDTKPTANDGQLYWNTDDKKVYVYNADAGVWTETFGEEEWVDEKGGDTISIGNDVSASTAPALTISSTDNEALGLSIINTGKNAGLDVNNNGSIFGAGIKTSSSTGTGIFANSNSTIYGAVLACSNTDENCALLGTPFGDYAGYFSGSAVATNEMLADKFVNTDTIYSSLPYIKDKIIQDKDTVYTKNTSSGLVPDALTLYNMEWDGNYIWAKGIDSILADPYFVKIRSSDLEILHIETTSVKLDELGDIVDAGEYVAAMGDYTGSCTTVFIDKDTMQSSGFPIAVTGDGCNSLVYDGQVVIMPIQKDVANGNVPSVYFMNNTISASGSDFIDIRAKYGCNKPQSVTYDGQNIWLTCSDGPNSKIVRIEYTCSVSSVGVLSCSYVDHDVFNASGISPNLIFFDGTYYWVTYNNASVANTLKKFEYDPISSSFEVVAEIDVGVGATDIDFDGSNIWVTNSTTQTMYMVPVHSVSSYTSYDLSADDKEPLALVFDGNAMISSYDDTSGSSEPGLMSWATSTGGFGTGAPNHFRGIIMTDDSGVLWCSFLHYDFTGSKVFMEYAANGTDDFKQYCGE